MYLSTGVENEALRLGVQLILLYLISISLTAPKTCRFFRLWVMGEACTWWKSVDPSENGLLL